MFWESRYNKIYNFRRDKMVRFYPMRELSGTTATDKSTNTENATYTNITLANTAGFDGSPAPLFAVASSPQIDILTNLWTDMGGNFNEGSVYIEAKPYNSTEWSTGTKRYYFEFKGDTVDDLIQIRKGDANPDALIATYTGTGGGTATLTHTKDGVTTTNWQVLLLTWKKGGNFVFYYCDETNCEKVGQTAIVRYWNTELEQAKIGCTQAGTLFFNGWLHFFAMWNYQVTDTEATYLIK